jgi:ATP-dependent Lon protease
LHLFFLRHYLYTNIEELSIKLFFKYFQTSGVHGDPAAAMLEVLDPEQNCNFVDHYLNVPFDLSQIIFIATANDLKTIARPLRDRMEIIQIPGYTFEDKLPIGKIHLLPKQIKMHGIDSDILQVTDEALKFISENFVFGNNLTLFLIK